MVELPAKKTLNFHGLLSFQIRLEWNTCEKGSVTGILVFSHTLLKLWTWYICTCLFWRFCSLLVQYLNYLFTENCSFFFFNPVATYFVKLASSQKFIIQNVPVGKTLYFICGTFQAWQSTGRQILSVLLKKLLEYVLYSFIELHVFFVLCCEAHHTFSG